MTGFLTPLRVELTDESAGTWRLTQDLHYQSARAARRIVVPAGFVTNYASVPRLQFGSQAPEYELRVATPNGEARFTGKANGEVRLQMPGRTAS